MQPLNSQDFQSVLSQLAPDITVQVFTESTATAPEAAARIGCELGQIVKSLLFMVNGDPVLILGSGDQQVDQKKVATFFDVGRKKVKIAKFDECVAITGYAPGGVPPLGHRTENLPTHIDNTFKRYEQVYAAAGDANAIFPITLNRLVELTGGEFLDVHRQ